MAKYPSKSLANMLRAAFDKTPGGGMKDDVPAMIDGERPAALSEGEYVIPADVVAMLGDGSTDKGVRVLDEMVRMIREQKQGRKKQAPSIQEILE